MIPSVSQCTELMGRYEMLANIKDHSFMVARVTALLSRELQRSGLAIDLDLALAGALLHDIAKTQCLGGRCHHAEVGVEICLAHGFAEVAEIVGEHVVLGDYAPENLSAKEVVYYADKRVNHDRIVSLGERLTYILERYGQGDVQRGEMIMENFEKCLLMEERIFSYLSFAPSQVPARVEAADELAGEYAESQ